MAIHPIVQSCQPHGGTKLKVPMWGWMSYIKFLTCNLQREFQMHDAKSYQKTCLTVTKWWCQSLEKEICAEVCQIWAACLGHEKTTCPMFAYTAGLKLLVGYLGQSWKSGMFYCYLFVPLILSDRKRCRRGLWHATTVGSTQGHFHYMVSLSVSPHQAQIYI